MCLTPPPCASARVCVLCVCVCVCVCLLVDHRDQRVLGTGMDRRGTICPRRVGKGPLGVVEARAGSPLCCKRGGGGIKLYQTVPGVQEKVGTPIMVCSVT